MGIHRQLILAPGALEGTRAPALWTCVGVLALAAVVCGAEAWRGVPDKWTGLQSFEIVPLTAVELIQERSGTFTIATVSRGEALLLAMEKPVPDGLAPALVPLSTAWALPIHADLKLGFARIRALNHNSALWTVSLFDRQVVRIASADGELLRYPEFQQAWDARRQRMAGWAGASALAAVLLAAVSRRMLSALAGRNARSQASPGLKSL